MRVGLQLLASLKEPWTPGGVLEQALRTVMLAEELGFDVAWVSEHHRTTLNICNDPLTLLASLASSTTRIRLGTAIVNLPLHNPSFLAERVSMVDSLSQGRLELGVGRGFATSDYELAGVDPAHDWDAFKANHQELLTALEDGTTTPCTQQPRPPIWLAVSGSERSLEFAARHGYGLLLAGKPERIQECVAKYRKHWRRDHSEQPVEVAITRAVHLADSREHAVDEIASSLDWYRSRMHELQPEVAPSPIDDIVDGFYILGAPHECIDAIDDLRRVSRPSMLNCVFGLGGMSPSLTERSIRDFAQYVLPVLRR